MLFKKHKINEEKVELVKVSALLIHAAKIDEDFSKEEELIIRQYLLKIGANKTDIEDIIIKAKKIEENSNQILDFTKVAKNMDEKDKIKIIETLWLIIYSNNEADMYETNLMRRLGNLMYIDNKLMGDIKENIRKKKITNDIYRK